MAKKVRVNEAEFVQRWKQGMQGAGQRYREGIEAVDESPTEKAADQKSVWIAQIQANADKWERNLRAVTLSDWKNAAVNKGAANLTGSVDVAEPKVRRNAGRIISAIDRALASMPARSANMDQNYERSKHIGRALVEEFS